MLVFLAFDLIFGFAAKQIFFNQKSGKYARITYSIQEASPDILIFGSSLANRHYVPEVIEKGLGLTCYNAGVQGRGLIFHTALEKMILERAAPKLIILNVNQNWMYKSETAYDGLNDFVPYYWDYRKILKPLLSLNTKMIDYTLLFQAYQTNSTIVHAIKYFFSPQIDYKGYRPMYGEMMPPETPVSNKEPAEIPLVGELDTDFIETLKSFIASAKEKNVDLIFVVAPLVNEVDFSKSTSLIVIKTIAAREGIPFYDFSNDTTYKYRYDLFADPNHLNDQGAHIFSQAMVDTIKADSLFDLAHK